MNSTLSPDIFVIKQTVEAVSDFDWRDIVLLLLFTLILIIGVIGNALVCYCFRNNGNKKLETMESLIYWLAVVDLCASIINPSLSFYWQITHNRAWHFGVIGCKILPTLAKVAVSISIGIILIITIDRCIIICMPFNRAIKQFVINLAVVGVIILSLITEVPHIVYLEPTEMKGNEGKSCVVPQTNKPTFAYPNIIIYILRDLFFLAIFCFTTILIYMELYNKETIKTLKHNKDLSKTKEVVIMIIVMAIVFIILVFPRDILHITYMISWLSPPGIPYSKSIRDINASLKILHMCNSICNVFIYAGLHGRFRTKLIKLFRKLFCCQRRANTNLSNSDTDTTFEDCSLPILMDRYQFENLPETCM